MQAVLAMSDQTPTLQVTFEQCEHGMWQGHNAVVFPDGTSERTEDCPGGVAIVEGHGKQGIPPMVDTWLRRAVAV